MNPESPYKVIRKKPKHKVYSDNSEYVVINLYTFLYTYIKNHYKLQSLIKSTKKIDTDTQI